MPSRIEDYAIIGDTKTVALVDLTGSIDWWCAPRIDSGAAFAALLGDAGNGRWLIAPKGEVTKVTRHYEPETLILETIFETSTGSAAVCDFMPPNDGHSMIHRIVESRGGTVEMQMELIVRYEYGAITPWATATGDGLVLVAARDGLRLHSPVRLVGKDNTTVASFSVSGDTRRSFSLTWFPSVNHAPLPLDSLAARNHTRHYWHDWVRRCTYNGGSRDLVVRSLITLKALTYDPTGAVCAAATTSLPETIGGNRNWDYRYSWLRDATFTLHALLVSGYTDEAAAWVGWLRRAVAGDPGEMQIMYGVEGERRLAEFELDHLSRLRGFNARPHRQQSGDPAPARRLRRGPGLRRHLLAKPHPPRVQRVAGPDDGDPRPPGDDLARARQRDLGGPRPAAALHPFEGHGLGGLRPRRHAGGERCLAEGTDGPLAASARRNPRGGLRQGLRP